MEGKTFRKFAKSNGKKEMSMTALIKGREYYDALMDAEYRGRKDTNGSARGRLADLLGVNENKLLRLEYSFDDMRDIGGELYRRLHLAYTAICEGNEAAAAAMRAERLKLKADRNVAHQKPVPKGMGEGAARD